MKKILFIITISLFVSCKTDKKEVVIEKVTEKHKVAVRKLENAVLASGSLFRIDSFPSKYIKPRPIDIWLPENYSEEKKYAILYT